MKSLNIKIENETGLHARPASHLSGLAQKYESDIQIEKEGKSINAKSIMSILSMGCKFGDDLVFSIDGYDEEAASVAVADFFENVLDKE